MAERQDLEFTYSLIDRIVRLSLGELADFSGAKYDGDFSHERMAAERAALINALAEQVGVPTLSDKEIDAVLNLAAVAAHGTGDRTSAPLASFIAGLAAAGAEDRLATIEAVRTQAAAEASE